MVVVASPDVRASALFDMLSACRHPSACTRPLLSGGSLLEDYLRRLAVLCGRLQNALLQNALPTGNGWHCVGLLLDKKSEKATYFIDLFCQLDYLLRGILSRVKDFHLKHDFVQYEYLLKLIQPAVDTCRYMYAACLFSATARSKYLTSPPPKLDITPPSIERPALDLDVPEGALPWDPISLQDFLERVASSVRPPGFIIYSLPLAPTDVLDLMLEIASIMRSLEERNSSHGHLSPQNLMLHPCTQFGHYLEFLEPSQVPSVGNCYIAPEIGTSKSILSHVYSYGSVCFNILTADVPNALKSTQTIGSRSEFYEFVKKGTWKQFMEHKPESLVSLIAWCWETEPTKRPTFTTISSFLRRAMRCHLFPSYHLYLAELSNFLQHSKYSLLNLYLSFTWSRDMRCCVVGTKIMNQLLESFVTDTMEQNFSCDFMCDKVMQAIKCTRMMRDQSNVQNFLSKWWSSEMVKASLRRLFCASTQELEIKEGFSEDKCKSLTAKSEEEEDVDCKSILTTSSAPMFYFGSLFDRSSVFKPAWFEQHSIIFEAFVYDRMVTILDSSSD